MFNSEKEFETILIQLLDRLSAYHGFSESQAILAFRELKECHQSDSPRDAFEQLVEDMRICVKYLLLDLDATRRENLCHHKLLDE